MIKNTHAQKRTKKVHDTENAEVTLYNFVRKHTKKVAGKFYSILSKEDIEDLIHDAYLKAYESSPRVKEDGNRDGWNWRICRNTVLDYAKAKTLNNERVFTYEEDFDDDDAIDIDRTSILRDITNLPDRNIIEVEGTKCFWEAIKRLSPESRKIVDLLIQGVPYEDMAQALGCSEGTLRVKICRARKELRGHRLAA